MYLFMVGNVVHHVSLVGNGQWTWQAIKSSKAEPKCDGRTERKNKIQMEGDKEIDKNSVLICLF